MSSKPPSYLRAAVLAAAIGLGVVYLARTATVYLGSDVLRKRLLELEAELDHIKKNRRADRAGRLRAETQLRQLQTELSASQAAAPAAQQVEEAGASGSSSSAAAAGVQAPQQPAVYPFKPIGTLRTCFTTRNGTPRQPLLVPAARAVLKLAPGVPFACLEGLEQYSHCWVLYVFHDNTDMGKVLPLGARQAVIKAKISVPRLDGGKMGVLATRSPHRPVPIGLSVARVLEVGKGRLVLGGVDIVDGSPVLDIKPYVPFCDSVEGAAAPLWVQAEATHEPLRISEVTFDAQAADAITKTWRALSSARPNSSTANSSSASSSSSGSSGRRGRASSNSKNGGGSLYASEAEFVELVRQVLSRDIRSLHQRLHEFTAQTRYHVVLEGINIQYEIDEAQGRVRVVGAELDRGDAMLTSTPEESDAAATGSTEGTQGTALAPQQQATSNSVQAATSQAGGSSPGGHDHAEPVSAPQASAAASGGASAAASDTAPGAASGAAPGAASRSSAAALGAAGPRAAFRALKLDAVVLADELEAPGTPHEDGNLRVKPQTPAAG